MVSAHTQVHGDPGTGEVPDSFSDERRCEDALYAVRWPEGFECRSCGGDKYCELRTRHLFQCNRCKNQVSLTAGTLFSWTRLPLTKWFIAIHLLMQGPPQVSAAELSRQLSINQNTAQRMKRKIMAALQDPRERTALEALVQGGSSTAS